MNILNFVDGVVIISMIGGLLVALISTVAVMRSREKDQEVLILKLVEEHVAATADATKSQEGVLATVRLLYSELLVQALKEQYLTFHLPLEALRKDLKASRGESEKRSKTFAQDVFGKKLKAEDTSPLQQTAAAKEQKINQKKNRPG